jgi:DNA-binding HxlR family transcriptional regulator
MFGCFASAVVRQLEACCELPQARGATPPKPYARVVAPDGSTASPLPGAISRRKQVAGSPARPMDVALDLIGTRSALALLQAAFCGARRFEDLIASAGVSTMIGATRLHEFVDAGLMSKRPYKSRQRTRQEYVVTELGLRCLPVVIALIEVGTAIDPASAPSRLLHAGCGSEFVQELHCAAGHAISVSPVSHRVAYLPAEDEVDTDRAQLAH